MSTFKTWLLDRLKERSTWLGVTAIVTSLGLILSPEQVNAIVAAGIAFAGLIAALFPEKPTNGN